MIFNSILPLVLDSKQALKATIEHSFQNCNSSTHLEFKYLKALLCASLKMCRIYTPPLQTHYWAPNHYLEPALSSRANEVLSRSYHGLHFTLNQSLILLSVEVYQQYAVVFLVSHISTLEQKWKLAKWPNGQMAKWEAQLIILFYNLNI